MINFGQMRCQHQAADGHKVQCALTEGHTGPHKQQHQLDAERNRNLHPTLDDIRQVVREEIERALGKRS